MNPQQQDPHFPGERVNARDTANFLSIVLHAHCMCFYPFLRRYFGWQFHGIAGFAAFILIFVFGGFAQSEGMLLFLMVWLAVMLVQRIDGVIQRFKGRAVHSRYDGYPQIGMGLCFGRSEFAAKVMEALLCGIIGVALMDIDETLGCFVSFGFVSLILKMKLDDWIDGMALQRMQDAQIEQQAMAQRYRLSLRGF